MGKEWQREGSEDGKEVREGTDAAPPVSGTIW